MNIFGIGPLEIIFILIIGILVLGPEGMVEAGKKLGRWMRSIIRSSWWQNIRQGINDIQYLPQRLIREAELEELDQLRKLTNDSLPSIGDQDLINSPWRENAPQDPPVEDLEHPDSESKDQIQDQPE
jgi:Sec-independent protein translocase protein TatA